MRIIFLDIDGPMIPDQVKLLPKKERFPLKKVSHFPYYSAFSPYSCSFIRQLVDGNNAKILTCSTHNGQGKDHIKNLFDINGLPSLDYLHPEICVDYCHGDKLDRDEACMKWVIDNIEELTGFVIIDDALEAEYDERLHKSWGIKASPEFGLTRDQLDQAKKALYCRKKGWTDDDLKLFLDIRN